VFQHRTKHDGRWHGGKQHVPHFRFARRWLSWRHETGVMRVVDGLAYAPLIQVVLELFAAVQAEDVALSVRLAHLGDRSYGVGNAAVGASEQFQDRVDHKHPRGLSLDHSRRNAWCGPTVFHPVFPGTVNTLAMADMSGGAALLPAGNQPQKKINRKNGFGFLAFCVWES
jgi:hypothetical protein